MTNNSASKEQLPLEPLDPLIAEDFSGISIGLWERHAQHIPEIERLGRVLKPKAKGEWQQW